MRSLLILLFSFLLMSSVTAQTKKQKIKNYAIVGGMALVSGAADGLNQAINYHYDRVDAKLHLNDKFWNPAISWMNKYKNNDPAQGKKYFGSTTFLVFTTDGHHATRFVSNLFDAGAIAIKFSEAKKKWYVYVLEGVGYWIVNRAGFAMVYNRF